MKIIYGRPLTWWAAFILFGLTLGLGVTAGILYVLGVIFMTSVLLICAACTCLGGMGAIYSYCKDGGSIQKAETTASVRDGHDVVKTNTEEDHNKMTPSSYRAPSQMPSRKNSTVNLTPSSPFMPHSPTTKFPRDSSETMTGSGKKEKTPSEFMTPSVTKSKSEDVIGSENNNQTNITKEVKKSEEQAEPLDLFGKDLIEHKRILPEHSVSYNGTPVTPLPSPTSLTSESAHGSPASPSSTNAERLDLLLRTAQINKKTPPSSLPGSPVHSFPSPPVQSLLAVDPLSLSPPSEVPSNSSSQIRRKKETWENDEHGYGYQLPSKTSSAIQSPTAGQTPTRTPFVPLPPQPSSPVVNHNHPPASSPASEVLSVDKENRNSNLKINSSVAKRLADGYTQKTPTSFNRHSLRSENTGLPRSAAAACLNNPYRPK
jgi:hypothetical protein